MNRDEFMQQLARLLSDMPESERMEAIRYYNDYFDEAGPENESKVIQELGSPGKVAAIIKDDLKDNPGCEEFRKKDRENEESGGMSTNTDSTVNRKQTNPQETNTGRTENRYQQETNTGRTENGYQQETNAGWTDNRYQQEANSGWNAQNNQQQANSDWNAGGYRPQNGRPGAHSTLRRRRGAGKWSLIIILLVFISPAIVGVGGGILGVLAGILAAVFGVLIAVFSAGVGMVGGGIALVVKGIIKLVTVPASGLVSIGGGLICIALGIFSLIFFCWLAFRLLPRFCRAVVNFISRLLHRGKGAAVQ